MIQVSRNDRGFSLVELIVAVGLFAFIMTLSSGSYLMMIGMNRQVQSITTGINDLSFALESMTRDIRTGSTYGCGAGGDCLGGGGSFSFVRKSGEIVTYSLSGNSLRRTVSGASSFLTDPADVTITSLRFYVSGTQSLASGDTNQPRVTMIVSGSVPVGPDKPPQLFTIQTGATMRGFDI